MLIAILSDIHANLPALQVVLNHLREIGNVKYILCAGDIVGYGPWPNEVCDILSNMKNFVSVLGNHDHAVLTGDSHGMDVIAVEAIEWTRRVISEDNLDFLRDMREKEPLLIDDFEIFLVHGSPRDPLNEYVTPHTKEETLKEFLDSTGADVLVMGHTHIPFIKEIGMKVVLNAGSVGQPRDKNPKACYVIMDTKKQEVDFHRISYDIDAVKEKMDEVLLPKELSKRLYFGK
jgi:putative phosphoesterase